MRDNNINTLRFLGALFVLVGHAFILCNGRGGPYDPITELIKPYTAFHARLPGLGVAMFFALSGYLVTRSFENRPHLLAYLEARVLRIYPALWVTLLLTVFVLGPAVTSLELAEYFSHSGTWRYLGVNALLFPEIYYPLPGVFLDNPQSGGVNGSLWTLPVEIRMYVIVACMGVLGLLKRRAVFNLVGVLMVIWYVVSPDQFFLLHRVTHERLGLYFLIGALFYVNRDLLQFHWLGLVLFGLLCFAAFGTPFYNPVFALAFSYLVFYVAFHPTSRLPDLAGRGDFSYGLYLYAFPATQLLIYLFGPSSPWLITAGTFLLAMLFAIGSWYFVEEPCLRLKGRFSGRWLDRVRTPGPTD